MNPKIQKSILEIYLQAYEEKQEDLKLEDYMPAVMKEIMHLPIDKQNEYIKDLAKSIKSIGEAAIAEANEIREFDKKRRKFNFSKN